nr:Flp pilus assembly complex ATPase component TadA [Candidatus Woesearchaeota archaeon]
MMNYIADTSVIIEKAVSRLVNEGKIEGRLLIPKSVLAELEHQANKKQETGFLGLEELQELQRLKSKGKIDLDFIGLRPTNYQIKNAKLGEIDSMIVDLAYNEGAVLITADKVQAESAKAIGLEVNFLELKIPKLKLEIEKFFDETTMSVHLKEDCFPLAKKGFPGTWNLVKINDKKLTQKEIQQIAKDVVERSVIDEKTFVEISREGSTIVQHKNYRIVIVKPPVSDGWEITAVRPIKKLNLEDYKLSEEISTRIKKQARGIIVAGEVGSGKSTFAQGLAEYYANNGKIVKTVESPRDLQLSDDITQYSKSFTSSEEIHDILFLSRPDNIIFDEIRDTPDFKLYIDLRLAGSNCLGVLHSASPIDAVQRFISRMETGMMPSVLDTIIFMENGNLKQILTLKMTVKVPTGMAEADLARPVVEVRDFETNILEYEIYSYGEETVVIPIDKEIKTSPIKDLAIKKIEEEFSKYASEIEVELVADNKAVIYVPYHEIAKIIGKQGKNIEQIEKAIGINIDIRELQGKTTSLKYNVEETSKYITFYIDKSNHPVDIFINDQFLFSATSSKKGEINIHRKSKLGNGVLSALHSKGKIEIRT